MTPLRLRISGLGVLRDVDLDLGALPEGLIAITGPNGAGKSTLLDAIGFAPYYRAWSSKPGELRDYARGPARLDLDVAMGGSVYALRLRVDPNALGGRGQTDATLARDGVPLTAGTRATDYDEAVCDWPGRDGKPSTRGVFPSRRLLLASAFAAQDRAGGFASLAPADRKALFGELLGTEEHQERSARARARGAELDAEVATLARDLERIEADRARAEGLRRELAAAEAERERTDAVMLDAEHAHGAAVAALAEARADADAVARERAVHDARAAELARDLAMVEAEIGKLDAQLADHAALAARADAIRARAAELTAATGELTEARQAYLVAQERLRATEADLTRATRDRDAASRALTQAAAAGAELESARQALPEAEALAVRAAALRADLDTATAANVQAERTARDLRAELERATLRARASLDAAERALTDAERRAGLLDGVPCGGGRVLVFRSEADEELGEGDQEDCASCRFLGDATAARDALPELRVTAERARVALADATARESFVDEAERELNAARLRVVYLRSDLAPLAGADAALAALRARVEALAATAGDLDALRAALDLAEGQAAAALTVRDTAARDLAAAGERGKRVRLAVERVDGADLELRRLDVATAGAEHIGTARATAQRRRTALLDVRATLGSPPDASARQEALQAAAALASRARVNLDQARAGARAAADLCARLRGGLDGLGDLDARAAELAAIRDRLALRRAGFAEVERAFGREGIQALEIDAAGPEVSTLTNELLATVAGGRFAVSLVTLQEASAGRKQREVFDLRVLDGEREHGGVAFERLSLGEQCLVGEALKLAIAVRNTRRSGRELRTLYRDEGDRDLDPERRAAYPAMLRRAMELGGFTRCYLISHDERVWAQANARIEVDAGRARIV